MSENSALHAQVPPSFSSSPSAEKGEITKNESSSHASASTLRGRLIELLCRFTKTRPECSTESSMEKPVDLVLSTIQVDHGFHSTSVDEYPRGYGKIATSMSLASPFQMYRKFTYLRTWTQLELQNELLGLEERLSAYEMKKSGGRRDQEGNPDQNDPTSTTSPKKLAYEIHNVLKIYDEMLLNSRSIHTMKSPLSRDQDSVKNILSGNIALDGYGVQDLDVQWIERSEDLVSVVKPPWPDGFFEDVIARVSRPFLRKFFRTRESKIKTSNIVELDLVSEKRINVLVGFIMRLLASFVLLVPLLVLYKLQQPAIPTEMERTGYFQILAIFIAMHVFTAILSFFTNMQRKEIFTAMITYCAVLVVFLGNSNNTIGALNGGVQQQPS